MKDTTKQLKTIDFKPPALADADRFREIMQANFGGREISPTDLSRVKFPTSGNTNFGVQDESGEDTQAQVYTGVVIVQHQVNAFWPGQFQGAEAPTCSSPDGFVGIGTPGGNCGRCPENQWKNDGTGKACKNMQRLFILTEGELLPSLLTLPPTSLKAWFSYLQFLAKYGHTFYEVVTEVSLEKAKSNTGIDYAKAKFRKIGNLKTEAVPGIKSLRENFLPTAQTFDVDSSDFSTNE